MSGGRWEITEPMIKFISRYVQRRVGVNEYVKRKNVDLALDVGCGNGNSIEFLFKQGIQTKGIDLSEIAITNTKERMNQYGFQPEIMVQNAQDMTFNDKTFDLVLSDGVLDHVNNEISENIISEIYRIMKDDAYLFISLRSIYSSEFGRGKYMNNNSYLLEGGYEDGELQHFYDLKEISMLLKDFNIFDIELHEEIFPNFYSLDKHFIQSSTGEKKYLNNLERSFENPLKNSRWFIAAEKK